MFIFFALLRDLYALFVISSPIGIFDHADL